MVREVKPLSLSLPAKCEFRTLLIMGNMREQHQAKNDVCWYISCFSKEDTKWAKEVMEGLGCKNYRLLSTIDACLRILSDRASCTAQPGND